MFSSRHFSFLFPIERQLATNKMLGCPFVGNSSETYNTTRRKTFIICEAFRCPRAKLDFNTLPFIEKSSTEVAYTFSARIAMAYNRASSFHRTFISSQFHLFPWADDPICRFRMPLNSKISFSQKYQKDFPGKAYFSYETFNKARAGCQGSWNVCGRLDKRIFRNFLKTCQLRACSQKSSENILFPKLKLKITPTAAHAESKNPRVVWSVS